MFQLHMFSDKNIEEENGVDVIVTKCINCNKDTGVHINNTKI